MGTSRDIMLFKLVAENHLNALERNALISLPTYSEVLQVVEQYFNQYRFLPRYIDDWKPDVFVYEGCCIEKSNSIEYPFILHYQQVGASMNVLNSSSRACGSLQEALTVYLHQLDYNIDGVEIINDLVQN